MDPALAEERRELLREASGKTFVVVVVIKKQTWEMQGWGCTPLSSSLNTDVMFGAVAVTVQP